MESGTDGGLVGRGSELAVLRSAVDRAATGGGATVLVLGEAGIGKSRLLAEAAGRARAAGMEVLAGRAVAGGRAFRAVAVALADRLRSQDDAGGRHGDLLADERLRGFLPALRRLLPAATPDGAPDEPRPDGADPLVVAGEGVLRLLGLLSADRGCLLLLEDLHWADADTLALVEYLAGGAAVLLVGSARDEGVGRGALARLVRVPAAMVLRPRRPSARETAALVAVRTPDLPADRVEARSVVGADGPRGDVRRALGIGLTRLGAIGEYVNVIFRADLGPVVGDRRYGLYAITHPDAGACWCPSATAGGATGGSGSPSAASRSPT